MFKEFGFSAARVEDRRVENERVVSLYLRTPLKPPKPGQFYMVWLPGAEEVPISASGYFNGLLRLSVSREGETSAKLQGLEPGQRIGIRGPYGRGFKLEGSKFLLVGGGYGMAPLIFAGHELKGKELTFLIGAKKRGELLFVDEARELGETLVATQDGSAGVKGLVTDLLGDGEYDWVLTCGPEPMMVKVLEHGRMKGWRVQLCLERYMKCGFGICGSCELGRGLRVCTDGPVFEDWELEGTDFGRVRRDPAGRKEIVG